MNAGAVMSRIHRPLGSDSRVAVSSANGYQRFEKPSTSSRAGIASTVTEPMRQRQIGAPSRVSCTKPRAQPRLELVMIGERDGAKHEIDILGRADRRRRRISDEQTRDRSADKHRVCQQLFTEPLGDKIEHRDIGIARVHRGHRARVSDGRSRSSSSLSAKERSLALPSRTASNNASNS
jgi:hypothetical protein